MRTFLVYLVYVALGAPLSAQVAKSSYHVPNNSDVTKTIPVKDRYLFDSFRKGKVYFRGGGKSESMLNYSFFHGEIQFIDDKKDTLLLADNQSVSRIVIDSLLFYYVPDEGHIQQIADFGIIRLGKKQKLYTSDTEHLGAYGGYSSTSSVSSYSTYTDARGQQQRLNAGSKVIMRKGSSYFWIDQNQRFYSASRANLTKIFPKNKREINDYFKENSVNLFDELDLTKLLEYTKSF